MQDRPDTPEGHDDSRAARLGNASRDLLILLGRAFVRIDHDQHDVGFVDRAQAPHEAVVLGPFGVARASAHAGRVDEPVSLATEPVQDPTSPFPDLPSVRYDFALVEARAGEGSGRVGADPSQIGKRAAEVVS